MPTIQHFITVIMFKKDGNYYLIMSGCSGWNPNAARSAIASSIWGEWKELGNPCIGQDARNHYKAQKETGYQIL